MKKTILILLTIFIGIGVTEAQIDKSKKSAKIEALKTAFITEKLDLTPAEAEKFWPLANQFKAKNKEVHKKYRSKKNVEDMTDTEADVLVNNHLAKQQELLNLKKDYIQQLKSVLPIKKIVKLQRANRQFKKELLKRSRKNKQKNKQKKKEKGK